MAFEERRDEIPVPIRSRIQDPVAGDGEVELQLAGDGLYIFGRGGKRLHRWPYDEIVHAFPAGASLDHVIARQHRPETRLFVHDGGWYALIAGRAPQLRRPGLRLFRSILQGIPEPILRVPIMLGLFLALAALAWIAGLFR